MASNYGHVYSKPTHRIKCDGKRYMDIHDPHNFEHYRNMATRQHPERSGCTWELVPIQRRGTLQPKYISHVVRNSEIPGRPAKEDNDCTVKALMYCTGWTYEQAHDIMRRETNRELGRGVKNYPLFRMLEKYGKRVDMSTLKGKTAQTILPQLDPARRYYVKVRNHVFAYIDGRVVDSYFQRPRVRVQAIWEIEKQ